jgi:pilus assembly protein CpaF
MGAESTIGSSLHARLRLARRHAGAPGVSASRGSTDAPGHELSARIHRRLLEKMDLAVLEALPPERLRAELRAAVEQLIELDGVAVNAQERERTVHDIQNEVLGLGPLEPLLADPSISEILVNGPNRVYVERFGRLELTGTTFGGNAHLMKIIDRMVSRVGRRIDESVPMVDARLSDGSRVNAIIPPLAVDGPMVSIRRFAVVPLTAEDLVRNGSMSAEIAQLLSLLVRAKVNLLVSGGTGSGKTTLLNILSGYVPETERIITIEDVAELQLQQPHVVRLETRPANIEGRGEITQRALVKNSLRMRPDRIIVGEVRADEVLDMLQAMNTGHEGSMTTIHANSPRDALTRMESIMAMSGFTMSPRALRSQISSAISVVVQIERQPDGSRRIVSLQEITGMEGDTVAMQEIFRFERTGVDAQGTVTGRFRALGIRPRFVSRLQGFGLAVDDGLFSPDRSFD